MSSESKFDIRDDEEQKVKLAEMLELLVAAGYFLARVKTIEPFDKVVGGMVWCIGACHYNVDVELMFHENSTIGQKIALTEKIVQVLPMMGCPHQIEPHQIQGLDCIHIFPVMQWLVRQSVVVRDQERQQLRLRALREYNMRFRTGENSAKTLSCLRELQEKYRPHRILRPTGQQPEEETQQVARTLMEYGMGVENVELDKNFGDGFQHARTQEQMVSTRTLEAIVDSQGPVIAALAEQFSSLNAEDSKTLMTMQKEALLEEMARVEKDMAQLVEEKKAIREAKEALREGKGDTEEKNELYAKLEGLIETEDSLRKQEQKFREHCREELERLQNLVRTASENAIPNDEDMDVLYETEKSRVSNLRLQIARKNRAVAQLQRQLDEIPGRAELSQYQKRFLELYALVSHKHAETKQLYMMYNTLDDTRVYLVKELNLLNSILDTYSQAMSSSLDKTLFIQQFEGIVAAVQGNKAKVQARRDELERKKEGVTQQLHELLGLQRHYYALVKQLREEVHNNEVLLSQLRQVSVPID